MGHKIDLSKFEIRCDLISEIIESKKIDGIKIEKNKYKNVRVERVVVENENSKVLNKKAGIYTTIFFDDITDYDNRNNVIAVTTRELKRILIKRKSLVKVY